VELKLVIRQVFREQMAVELRKKVARHVEFRGKRTLGSATVNAKIWGKKVLDVSGLTKKKQAHVG
jgi:hypothetical protein